MVAKANADGRGGGDGRKIERLESEARRLRLQICQLKWGRLKHLGESHQRLAAELRQSVEENGGVGLQLDAKQTAELIEFFEEAAKVLGEEAGRM